jgi:hypothetical protein
MLAHFVSSSTAFAFLTNMSEKHKSTSPSAIQVKNRRNTTGIEEKLDTISRFEKGEQSVHICHNVRLTHSSVHTICDNIDRIKESAKCLDNIKYQQSEAGHLFVQQNYHSPIGMNRTKNYGFEPLTFLLH